jgi:hypothetical protein
MQGAVAFIPDELLIGALAQALHITNSPCFLQ